MQLMALSGMAKGESCRISRYLFRLEEEEDEDNPEDEDEDGMSDKFELPEDAELCMVFQVSSVSDLKSKGLRMLSNSEFHMGY